MTNDARDGKKTERADRLPSDEAQLSERLDRLDARLSTFRNDQRERIDQSAREEENVHARASALARGFRLSTELIAGVVVGAILGWSIDYFLSTSPWGLIVFVLLGFIAGVLNVMRAAGVAKTPTLDDGDKR